MTMIAALSIQGEELEKDEPACNDRSHEQTLLLSHSVWRHRFKSF